MSQGLLLALEHYMTSTDPGVHRQSPSWLAEAAVLQEVLRGWNDGV